MSFDRWNKLVEDSKRIKAEKIKNNVAGTEKNTRKKNNLKGKIKACS